MVCLNYTPPTIERTINIFTVVCGPLSVIINSCVLYIAVFHINLRVQLHQWFVISMTVSDLIYALAYCILSMNSAIFTINRTAINRFNLPYKRNKFKFLYVNCCQFKKYSASLFSLPCRYSVSTSLSLLDLGVGLRKREIIESFIQI